VAGFTLDQAHTLSELEALNTDQRRALLMPADCLVAHLPAVHLDDAEAEALCQGRSVAYPTTEVGLTRVYTASHRFLGLAHAEPNQLVPRRLIATQAA
jgi:tRNA pseudouridine55 synthase